MMNSGFNWLDYTVLIGYIFFILAIASLFVKEQHNLTDFFMASRKMPWWAVGFSILATLLSTVSITGVPAEFWENGLRFCGGILILPAMVPIVIFVFVRIFHQLKIITAYEYLEKRFSLTVRLVASALFMLFRGSYIGVVIFGSAIILQPAIGHDVNIIWLIIGIGVFSAAFAVLGGMKAVIWTDVVQLVVIYGGIIWMAVTMLTRIDGGVAGMWQIAAAHDKDFSYLAESSYYSFDFFEKTTLWGLLLMYICSELSGQGTDQLTVQRYLTTGSVKASARSLWIYAFTALPMVVLLWFISMALFAFYKQNPSMFDPSVNTNGLLPFYIVTQLPHGISGLFIAAIMAAVLSTVDSGMNCLATATMNDFHLRLSKKQYNGAQHVFLARTWTIIWGIITTGLSVIIFLTARENIVRTVVTTMGMFQGPLLGIFLLGVLTRRTNAKGVCTGAALGLALAFWVNYGWTKTGPDGEVMHVFAGWTLVLPFLATLVTGFVTSLFFPAPAKEKLEGLTHWNK